MNLLKLVEIYDSYQKTKQWDGVSPEQRIGIARTFLENIEGSPYGINGSALYHTIHGLLTTDIAALSLDNGRGSHGTVSSEALAVGQDPGSKPKDRESQSSSQDELVPVASTRKRRSNKAKNKEGSYSEGAEGN